MRESTPLHVLATKPNCVTIFEYCSKSKRFSCSIINSFAFLYRLSSSIENLHDLRVECPNLGNLEEFESHGPKLILHNVGVFAILFPRVKTIVIESFLPFGGIEIRLSASSISRVDSLDFLLHHFLLLLLSDDPLHYKLLGVDVVDSFVGKDWLVHHRLGESRLILLIMAKPSVTNNVNEDVAFKLLSELERHSNSSINQLRLICIYVNDGGLDWFGHICTIEASSSLSWGRCEADLVVCYNVNHSPDLVLFQLLHLKSLIYDSLTG